MPAALNTTEDPDQDAPPPQNGEKQPMRKLKLSGAEPTAGGVKLSMRKLSFDSHVARLSQEQAKTLDEASANGSGSGSNSSSGGLGGEGLPTLLKRLRKDAQEEIERATAGTYMYNLCLSREIRLLEQVQQELVRANRRNLERIEASHNEKVEKLRLEIERLHTAGDALREETRIAQDARAETVRTERHSRAHMHTTQRHTHSVTHTHLFLRVLFSLLSGAAEC